MNNKGHLTDLQPYELKYGKPHEIANQKRDMKILAELLCERKIWDDKIKKLRSEMMKRRRRIYWRIYKKYDKVEV